MEPSSLDRSTLLRGVRVLAVDDDDDTRELVRCTLERAGATVVTAPGVDEGLDLLVRERPDVLVSDIGMPEKDGFDLIRQVRTLEASLGGETPAIALTAFTGPVDKARTLGAGFQIYLEKPKGLPQLVNIIQQLLHRPPGRASA